MESGELTLYAITLTAVSTGVVHTVLGPDHYLPFVSLGKARSWTGVKTLAITFICGMAHVLSSVIIGLGGLALGKSMGLLENIEGGRADIAKWLLLGLGLAYMVYGLRKALRGASKTLDLSAKNPASIKSATLFWVLFIIFAFGPCEVLIPQIIYPAAEHNWGGVLFVTSVFGTATISTMLVMTASLFYGLNLASGLSQKLFAWKDALAGGAIAACAGLMFAGL